MPDTQPVSPVLDKQDESVPAPKYSRQEEEYLGKLQKRFQAARDLREHPWDEFDGMPYSKYVEENRKAANSYIKPRGNPQESNFVTGTTRQKLLSILAHIQNLDLSPEVQAFDDNDQPVRDVAEAIEDLIFKTEELDDDAEKQLMRLYTLLEQGTVFVEEVWDVSERKLKEMKTPMSAYDGKVSGVTWTERMKRVYEGPRRNVLRNENVYLGSYTTFAMEAQPFMFTVDHMDWEQAKAVYGTWERWKHVPRTLKDTAQSPSGLYNAGWSLTTVPTGKLECMKYQDPWSDEYQILLNGVMMLPVGFPLPWRWQKFNIEKQVLEVISSHFPLGKSLCSRLRVSQALIDEMMRLAVLKTQKSFLPPRANNTGRMITNRVFFPGKITAGVDPSKLPALEETQGLTNGEASMIQMLFRNMDENTIDPTMQGQTVSGDPTATQIITVKQQAERMLGITVFVAAEMEKKLAYLRLANLLQHYFEPVDERVDEVNGTMRPVYRGMARSRTIDGEGPGLKMVRVAPREYTPSAHDIMIEEDQLAAALSVPVRIAYLDPDLMKKARLKWYIVVKPTEKKTSELSKAIWDQFLERMKNFPNANWDYLGVRTAEKWGENPGKVFHQQQPMMPGAMPGMTSGMGPEMAALPGVPQLKNQASLRNMAGMGGA